MDDNVPRNADISIPHVCDTCSTASTKVVLIPIHNRREDKIHTFAIK